MASELRYSCAPLSRNIQQGDLTLTLPLTLTLTQGGMSADGNIGRRLPGTPYRPMGKRELASHSLPG